MAARRRRENIVVVVLAILAVLGGGHAVADAFASPPPAPSSNATVSLMARGQLVGSFAREFVITYLGASSGQQDRLGEFVEGAAQAGLPSIGRAVSDPVIVHVTRARTSGDLDVWAVTVSVRVGARPGATDGSRQYYRVAVSVTNGRLRALSLPAAVEAPGRGVDLALAYTTTCPSDTPLAQVSTGFLQALLTANGDIARYVTPESGITALRPAPFTAVEAVTVRADDSDCGARSAEARVLTTITPKAEAGSGTPALTYPLTMLRQAGQWQVRAVDSVPALRDPLTAATGELPHTTPAPTSGGARRTSTPTIAIPPPTQN
ncbi:conjugal transfer protein [Nocardia sp. NPDC004722]